MKRKIDDANHFQQNVSIIAPYPLILLGALFRHMNHSAIFVNDKGIKVTGYFFLDKKGFAKFGY
jgi:hypothetical protein